jgi:hypothetical protein
MGGVHENGGGVACLVVEEQELGAKGEKCGKLALLPREKSPRILLLGQKNETLG